MTSGEGGTSGGTRVARRRATVVRELLDTALALIERDGVAAITMCELAAQIGMRPQSLSEYFASKAALLDACSEMASATSRSDCYNCRSPTTPASSW
jgi:AcrR family transcriptional regulator